MLHYAKALNQRRSQRAREQRICKQSSGARSVHQWPTEEICFSDVCIKAIALFNSQGFQEINFSFQTIDTKTSLSFLLCCFCGCAFHVTLLNLKLYWRRWTKGYMKVCHLSPSRKLKVLESLSLWIYSLNNVIINAALSIPQTLPFQFLCNLPS